MFGFVLYWFRLDGDGGLLWLGGGRAAIRNEGTVLTTAMKLVDAILTHTMGRYRIELRQVYGLLKGRRLWTRER